MGRRITAGFWIAALAICLLIAGCQSAQNAQQHPQKQNPGAAPGENIDSDGYGSGAKKPAPAAKPSAGTPSPSAP